MKNLKWDFKTDPTGKTSYFINLYITENNQKQDALSISLTQGEFYVVSGCA